MDSVQVNVQIKDVSCTKIKPTIEKITSKSLETAASKAHIQQMSATVNKLKSLTQRTAQIMEIESGGSVIVSF